MSLKYRVRAKIATTKDDKAVYREIGSVFDRGEKGLMLKLEVIPTTWDGFAYLNEPEDDRNAQ